MATWFTITYEGDPTEDDYARVSELAAQGFTSGQLINDEPEDSPAVPESRCPGLHAVDNYNQAWCGGTPVPASHLHQESRS